MVGETGTTAQFSVVLDTAPIANVNIALSSSDPSEGTLSSALLTFTPFDWNTPKLVTVTGIDDSIVDGDVGFLAVTAAASSTDPQYNGIDPADVSITNQDNDTFNTIAVSTTADTVDGNTASIAALIADRGADGRISLREAILAANNTPNGPGGGDRIDFIIPDALVGGAHTIALTSALPQITDAVLIDATTEPDYVGTPMVVLDGAALPVAPGNSGLRLDAGSSGSTIRGLVLVNMGQAGIAVTDSSSHVIAGNQIGVATDGVTAAGNAEHGIVVSGTSSNLTIGGGIGADRNLIGGNSQSGIRLDGAGVSQVDILGNYIGITRIGNAAVGNGAYGIEIVGAVDVHVGGTNAADGNVVSGNGGDGILVDGAATTVIEGNLVGTDAFGAYAIANTGIGISVLNGAIGTQIGGQYGVAGNIIAGNGTLGIAIAGAGTTATAVQGNVIGLGSGATVQIANGGTGIAITGGASGSLIGGIASQRNVISANGAEGIYIDGAATTGNTVDANYIGTAGDGVAVIGNTFNGIVLTNGAHDNLIGGAVGNRIAGSNAAGINLTATAGTGNALLRNLVWNSAQLGIDLGNDGVDVNDIGDGDTGPNDHLNHPVLVAANSSGGNSSITGTLDAEPSTSYRIEFFSVPAGQDHASGHGEAQVYLGATTVVTDGSGHADIGVFLTGMSITGGDLVTATATVDLGGGLYGSTSEFGANVVATNTTPNVRFTATGASDTTEGGGIAQYNVVLDTVPTADVTVALAVSDSTEASLSTSSLTFTTANWNIPQLITLTGIDDSFVDGNVGYTLITGAATSADPVYNGLDPSDPVLTNLDDDVVNTVVVTTTADTVDGDTASIANLYSNMGADGRISLREALLAANGTANAGGNPDHIEFDIPDALVGGRHTISVSSALPSILDAVVIDGTSEPDYGGLPVVVVSGALAGASVDGLTISGANGTVITGLSINQFSGHGILVSAANVTLQSNWIGLDANGTGAAGNGGDGIHAVSADNLTVGGTLAAYRNVISGNASGAGIAITGPGGTGTRIEGNFIGTDLSGTLPVANAYGVSLDGAATGVAVGGTNAGTSNTIAHNTAQGVVLASSDVSNVSILGNQILANGALGIDLDGDGPTANDASDLDTGANSLLNFPVLSSVSSSGATTYVSGSYHGEASTTLRIEFFASVAVDASGYGEAERLLGYTTIVTNGSGNAAFSNVALAAVTANGEYATATATVDLGGGNYGATSEFAQSVIVSDPAPILDLDPDDSSGAGTGNFATTFSEGGGPVVVADVDATIVDPDSLFLSSMTITLLNPLDGANDQLSADTTGTAITAVYNPGTGVLSLSNLDTIGNYQQVLRTVRYENTSSNPDTTTRIVQFVANDGTYDSGIVTASVAIAPINDPPTITSDGGGASALANVAENSTAVTTVTSTDPDGGVPAYTISGGADAAFFTIDINSGILSFVAAPDFETPLDGNTDNVYELTVQVDDGNGGFDSQNISVAVTNVNEPPAISSDGGGATASLSIAENIAAVTTVTSTDVDGGVPAYTITGGADAALFTLDINTGALAFVVAPDFESPLDANTDNVYELTVQVDDGNGGFDSQDITVTVTPANDNAPVITSDGAGATASVSVAENGTAVTTVTATDADLPAQTITFSITGGADAALFTIDTNTGALAFIAAPDFETPLDANTDNVYEVTVQADDGNGLTDSQDISVTVTDLNDNAPVITSDGAGATASVSVAENVAAVTTVTATDADLPAQTITFSITGGADAALFTIDTNTGALAFIAAPDFETPLDANTDNVYELTVQADDGNGLTDSQDITVTVTAVNDNAPVITSDGAGATASINVAENGTAVTTVTATDADLPAQTVTFSITGGVDAALFTIDTNTGALAFIAAPDFETPLDANTDNVYEITVQADDGNGLTDSQDISVAVTNVNEPPTISSDGGGATASLSIAENIAAVTTVTSTDVDGGVPAYTITGGADAALFTLDINTGALAFVVAPDFETPLDANTDNVYELTVQVDDGNGGFDSQDITVTVTAANDNAPVITSDGAGATASVSVAENGTAVTTVTATDADLPAQTVTFSITGGADVALFTIDTNTGALAFIAAPDFETPLDANTDNVYEVTVQADDGNGLTDSQDISVTVTDLNDNAPVITSDGGGATASVNVAENVAAVTTVTATDADLPAQTITFSITGGADAALFTIDTNTGALAFIAAPDFETPLDANTDNVYELTVQADDGNGLTDSQDITVTVTAVNEFDPVITSDGGGATASLNVAENVSAVTTVVATDADLPASSLSFSISGARMRCASRSTR
ncbi:MAG: cadherin domain-containing protein [Burkholderiaceae bacterium]